jgi:hypothetical protein
VTVISLLFSLQEAGEDKELQTRINGKYCIKIKASDAQQTRRLKWQKQF